jgi:two-component system, OmpR family, KDP operon response regulator KdpE
MTTAEESVPGDQKKILVVEDETISLRAVSQLLLANGYAVVPAADGANAVTLAASENPDLIILDLGLPSNDPFGPQWDGFGVMDWLNRMRMNTRIPVIVLTSMDPADAQQRALEAGAVAFFQKPAGQDELLAAVRIALGERG